MRSFAIVVFAMMCFMLSACAVHNPPNDIGQEVHAWIVERSGPLAWTNQGHWELHSQYTRYYLVNPLPEFSVMQGKCRDCRLYADLLIKKFSGKDGGNGDIQPAEIVFCIYAEKQPCAKCRKK